jgi:hypothetical protein
MENLTELNLYYNNISDLTPLSGLVNLSVLELVDNQISDLTPIAELTNLTRLSLGQNQILDLTPLNGLINLEVLHIEENRINDLTPIAGLANLTILSARDNRISDWSPVAHIPNVSGKEYQTGEILTADEAQQLLYRRFHEIHELTHMPDMDKWKDGVLLHGFIVDYSAQMPLRTLAHAYAWVNSVTREIRFEEAGYTEENGPNWYANIPDSMFPIPMRDGEIIPYDRFTPPTIMQDVTYDYEDLRIMEIYQAQLRDAGFGNYVSEWPTDSYWLYHREEDGTSFDVNMWITDEEGLIMTLVVFPPLNR